MKYLIIIFSLLTVGCSGTSIYVGTGIDANTDHIGNNPVAVVRVDQEITENVSCGWLHVSNVLDGKPFNSRDENVSDIGHCGYTYKFK